MFNSSYLGKYYLHMCKKGHEQGFTEALFGEKKQKHNIFDREMISD